MSITSLLAVGTGGALGAMGRWGLSLLPFRGEFPLLTLATNLLGAVLIGFIAGWAGRGAAVLGLDPLLEDRRVRRLHHLLHLLPGEPDPAGEGEVAAGRELHGPQRGPLSPGRGPGAAAEPDLTVSGRQAVSAPTRMSAGTPQERALPPPMSRSYRSEKHEICSYHGVFSQLMGYFRFVYSICKRTVPE
mgnify:CR=1 FL=1